MEGKVKVPFLIHFNALLVILLSVLVAASCNCAIVIIPLFLGGGYNIFIGV